MAPYFPLMTADASQRTYRLREVFNGLCWLVPEGPHGVDDAERFATVGSRVPTYPTLAVCLSARGRRL